MMQKQFDMNMIRLCFVLLISFQSLAQFNYVAQVKDSNGVPVGSSVIDVKISINDFYDESTIFYSETHQTSTTADGIITLEIGKGKDQSGDFNSIDWSKKLTLIDFFNIGGTGYVLAGKQPISSVPLAEYSKSVNGLKFHNNNNSLSIGSEAKLDSIPSSIVIGSMAGYVLKGSDNIVVGKYSGTTLYGDENIAIGSYSLAGQYETVNKANGNTAVGYFSMLNNKTGTHNTAIGWRTLITNTSGNKNVAIGQSAGLNNKDGHNNIFIGYRANVDSSVVEGITNSIVIGSDISVTRSNTIQLGNIDTQILNTSAKVSATSFMGDASELVYNDSNGELKNLVGELLKLRSEFTSYKNDTDGDGIDNSVDPDDDNDGVADEEDEFPLDELESKDTDGDGIGDYRDTDDDNDGFTDTEETASGSSLIDPNDTPPDTDGDGTVDGIDTDDDNDGVNDEQDAFPKDPNETEDFDGDGIGNNSDTDDDNDGFSDTEELSLGSNPLSSDDTPIKSPTGDLELTVSGENSVQVEINITYENSPSFVNRNENLLLKYKTHEEMEFKSILISDFSIDGFKISAIINIEDLIQGPQYTFVIAVGDNNTINEYINLPVTYQIGDKRFGGYIVYIDESGYHGYVCTEFEYVKELKWFDGIDYGSSLEIHLKRNLYEEGDVNTQKIIEFSELNNIESPAAKYCYDLSLYGYEDWFLPSEEERDLIQETAWDALGNKFKYLEPFWTSNTSCVDCQGGSEFANKAIAGCENGCRGYSTYDFTSKVSVLPIRKF